MSAVLRGRPQTMKKVKLDQIAYRVLQGVGDRMQLRILAGAILVGALAACGGGSGTTALPAVASTLESTQAANPTPAPLQPGTVIIRIPTPDPNPTASLCPPGYFAIVNGQTGAFTCLQVNIPSPGPSTTPTPRGRT